MHESDTVEQEDGYLSPSPSLAQWDSPDISSPVRPGPSAGRRRSPNWDEDGNDNDNDNDDFLDADVLSSPPMHRHARRTASTSGSVTVERTITRALPLVPLRAPRFGRGDSTHTSVRTTTSRTTSTESFDSRPGHGHNGRQGREDADRSGPDLRDTFDDWDEVTSGGEDEEWFAAREDSFHSTASSTPGPVTPSELEDDIPAGADEDGDVKMRRAPSRCAADEGSSEELEEEVVEGMRWARSAQDGAQGRDPGDPRAGDLSDGDNDEWGEAAARNASAKVAHGWWAKWARSGTPGVGLPVNAFGDANARGGSSDRVHGHAQLRRRETTITPDGRQRPLGRAIAPPGWAPRSAPQLVKRKGSSHEGEDLRTTGRTRLTFTAAVADVVVVTGAPPSRGRGASVKTTAQAQAQARWTPACR
ncbi:hypothetical protein GY45DRAFT_1347696 [Cubamyces sp. BRFM 1775]|nr:hypothetical protein GY45DRAFT_1347696 [Cubamyces sp. BRFM 1775]